MSSLTRHGHVRKHRRSRLSLLKSDLRLLRKLSLLTQAEYQSALEWLDVIEPHLPARLVRPGNPEAVRSALRRITP